MRSPTRRSKKIGVTQGGRVKHGRPREKWSRLFTRTTWQKLTFETESDDGPRIIRENSSRDFFHPCTSAEIRDVLGQLHRAHRSQVRAVVLRRTPKVDQKLFIEARMRYGCVILNAFPRHCRMPYDIRNKAVANHYAP